MPDTRNARFTPPTVRKALIECALSRKHSHDPLPAHSMVLSTQSASVPSLLASPVFADRSARAAVLETDFEHT
ncbi:hypothetical protein GCM10007298_11670 [Williamsia phyllosphaerae]|uniref:Uncharacterized protein n=1 Tax=Williamsia phyllosphaerae TaxID=885042 RepID=A0ABQ1UII8_9NOCA|nr:hypothetical protein GCM10007298_11670 [Williamsia phyllosphaerae]